MTTMNPITVSATRFTPDDLLAMPDAVNYELVDGKLVERKMSMESSRVGLRIGSLLLRATEGKQVGDVFGADASYQCFADDPDKVRKPDVSFVAWGRATDEQLARGHLRVPPDLAVEVVSPNDLAYDVAEKVEEYRKAGVRLVWVVYPPTRHVAVYRAGGPPGSNGGALTGSDVISGEDVVPGFSCRVSDFFFR